VASAGCRPSTLGLRVRRHTRREPRKANVLEILIIANHEEIVARVNAQSDRRGRVHALASSVPVVLQELVEGLRRPDAPPAPALQEVACQHAAAARRAGLPISDVARHYADICGAVTDIAVERGVAVGAAEFGVLRRSVDAATASGLTEYQRKLEQAVLRRALNELGRVAHDLRTQLTPALHALNSMAEGDQLKGARRDVVEQSLERIRAFIAHFISDVRTRGQPPCAPRIRAEQGARV
jgi:hypothetical protein